MKMAMCWARKEESLGDRELYSQDGVRVKERGPSGWYGRLEEMHASQHHWRLVPSSIISLGNM